MHSPVLFTEVWLSERMGSIGSKCHTSTLQREGSILIGSMSVAVVWVPAVLGAAGAGTSWPWNIQGAGCTW